MRLLLFWAATLCLCLGREVAALFPSDTNANTDALSRVPTKPPLVSERYKTTTRHKADDLRRALPEPPLTSPQPSPAQKKEQQSHRQQQQQQQPQLQQDWHEDQQQQQQHWQCHGRSKPFVAHRRHLSEKSEPHGGVTTPPVASGNTSSLSTGHPPTPDPKSSPFNGVPLSFPASSSLPVAQSNWRSPFVSPSFYNHTYQPDRVTVKRCRELASGFDADATSRKEAMAAVTTFEKLSSLQVRGKGGGAKGREAEGEGNMESECGLKKSGLRGGDECRRGLREGFRKHREG